MINQKLPGTDIRIEKLLENSYFGLVLLDTSFTIIYSSQSAQRINGWADAGVPQTSILNIIHPRDRPDIEEVLQSIQSTSNPQQSLGFRWQHANGHYLWLEGTFTNMLYEQGIEAIVCNFADVSAQKKVEQEFRKQSNQINELLSTMTDGFLSLDENLCYTYLNTAVLRLMGREAKALIGKHIWDIFPEMIDTTTYYAIQTALEQKIYVCNEEFYEPLQLWYENRVYPSSAGGVSMFIRDITKQKKEDAHLKLLESVITHTTDAILITEAEPFDEPGPRILYVNEAFTQMTGYTADEVIGKTPRILQGPKTDKNELRRIGKSLRKWQPCEATVVNYKKNGEEFWINIAMTPVADENGWYTHWISVERDVTKRKNEELQAALLADISMIFNEEIELSPLLNKLLHRLVDFGQFMLAEVWLVGTDKNRVNLSAGLPTSDSMKRFYEETTHIKSFAKAGANHSLQKTMIFHGLKSGMGFLRLEAAVKAGIGAVFAIPLVADNVSIGGLILGLSDGQPADEGMIPLFDTLGSLFGTEIKRKQLEQELKQLFNSAPDIICVLGTDYYFKKVNPAMCKLLEYTEEELLSAKLPTFLHPDEWETSKIRLQSFVDQTQTLSFENRFVTRSGRPIWLSWTASNSTEEGLIFGVAKDVTDKKELKTLLDKVTSLARVGGWEVDLLKGSTYWSQITKEIHEVEPNFEPGLQTGFGFYKAGHDREAIAHQMRNCVEKGTAIDIELQIITAKGNSRWVRVVGEPEFVDGKCLRVYGSFQDIDARVNAEISANTSLEERNVILESIGDAFFAVDKNWVVTYWNNMAEKVLRTPKANIVHQKLWEVFSGSTDSFSYRQYHQAMESGRSVHFEDHYPTLNKWYDISAYPSVSGLSVYFKDITERKVTDELLKDSEKRYSELFQLSPLPNLVFDLDTLAILDINEVAIKHYGYSREEFLSMTIKDIRPVEDIPALDAVLAEYKDKPLFSLPDPVRHKKKNGEIILVEIKTNNINYQGKNARVVAANDITERLNYTKAVEDQNERLKEISWIQSHIVRAPLSRIMGLIPLLNDPKESEAVKKQILEYISISAYELDDVIKDITDKTTQVHIDHQ